MLRSNQEPVRYAVRMPIVADPGIPHAVQTPPLSLERLVEVIQNQAYAPHSDGRATKTPAATIRLSTEE